MTYERPAVLATYKVEELMKDAAVSPSTARSCRVPAADRG
jgi:hypothetical protein